MFSKSTFFHTYFVNNEVVNKAINLWTIEEERKLKQGFKSKSLIISVLNTRDYNYFYIYSTAKGV